MSVDVATGGALMGKSVKVAKALLEDMAANNYHQSNKRAPPRKGSGKYDIDAMDMLASKVDALAQRFDRMDTPNLGSSCGTIYTVGALCEICGIQGHLAAKC